MSTSAPMLSSLQGRAFDVAYAQAMIAHHQSAVTMAQQELAGGKVARVKVAAKAVIAAQQQEIELMNRWLKSWNASGTAPTMHLSRLPAGQTDRWFLTQMIPHHQEAVQMSVVALKDSQTTAVKNLARRIIAAQTQEVQQYRAWLRQLK